METIYILFVVTEIVDLFFVDTTPFVDKYFIQLNKHVYDWRGVLPRQTYLNNLLEVTIFPTQYGSTSG